MSSSPDVADFLARLSQRDEPAAWLARRLLDSGWVVQDLCGPVQMDVWQLLLQRGTCRVRFGIERGYSDGVLVADRAGAYRPIGDAMSASGHAGSISTESPTVVLHWLNGESDKPNERVLPH